MYFRVMRATIISVFTASGYLSDEWEDLLADGEWQRVFQERPQPLTAEEKKDFIFVPTLLEGDAEDVLVLLGGGGVIRVDLDHVVAALFLAFQNLQGLGGVAGGDDAVGDLGLEVLGRGDTAATPTRSPPASS